MNWFIILCLCIPLQLGVGTDATPEGHINVSLELWNAGEPASHLRSVRWGDEAWVRIKLTNADDVARTVGALRMNVKWEPTQLELLGWNGTGSDPDACVLNAQPPWDDVIGVFPQAGCGTVCFQNAKVDADLAIDSDGDGDPTNDQDVLANDGNAQLNLLMCLGQPLELDPGVTMDLGAFVFRVLAQPGRTSLSDRPTTGRTEVSIPLSFACGSQPCQTIIFNGVVPNVDVTGTLSGVQFKVVGTDRPTLSSQLLHRR